MLTLQEFIVKYGGIPHTGDTNENRGQCTGLAEVWIDNLGLSHDWGNAKDLLADANKNDFTVVMNDPKDFNQFPPSGAIVVWGASFGNGLGHVGVVVTADGHTLHCFEQNNPTGSAPQVVSHLNYGGVLGWLVPKRIPDDLQKQLNDANKLKDDYYNQLQTALHTISDLKGEIDALKGASTQKDTVPVRNSITVLHEIANYLAGALNTMKPYSYGSS